MFSISGAFITLKVDLDVIDKLQLDITMADIVSKMLKAKKLKLNPNGIKVWHCYIRVKINSVEKNSRGAKAKTREDIELFARLQHVKRMLPDVSICGYVGATRAVIKSTDLSQNSLLVEGYGLRNCMTTQGVNGLATRTNSVIEMRDVLGIEAARTTIIDEISTVMGDMDIDPRHMQLLADVMTYRGEVLGITRFGLSKMRDSVLQLASFEKTPDHLFEAAWHAKKDKVEGVSECIIMGQSMSQGTGAFQVVKRLKLGERILGRNETVFEDTWGEMERDSVRERRR